MSKTVLQLIQYASACALVVVLQNMTGPWAWCAASIPLVAFQLSCLEYGYQTAKDEDENQ